MQPKLLPSTELLVGDDVLFLFNLVYCKTTGNVAKELQDNKWVFQVLCRRLEQAARQRFHKKPCYMRCYGSVEQLREQGVAIVQTLQFLAEQDRFVVETEVLS